MMMGAKDLFPFLSLAREKRVETHRNNNNKSGGSQGGFRGVPGC